MKPLILTPEQDLLKRASTEIATLRDQNKFMKARLDMFDSIMAALHTQIAYNSEGMTVDLLYDIEKLLKNQAQ